MAVLSDERKMKENISKPKRKIRIYIEKEKMKEKGSSNQRNKKENDKEGDDRWVGEGTQENLCH